MDLHLSQDSQNTTLVQNKAEGFRIRSISVYGLPGNERYATVWAKFDSGTRWTARIHVPRSKLDELVADQRSHNRFPSLISATGTSPDDAIFAIVFDEFPHEDHPHLQTDLSLSRFAADLAARQGTGQSYLRSVATFGFDQAARYFPIYSQLLTGRGEAAIIQAFSTDETVGSYNAKRAGHSTVGVRTAFSVPTLSVTAPRRTVVWQDDVIAQHTAVGLSRDALEALHVAMSAEGFGPAKVHACGMKDLGYPDVFDAVFTERPRLNPVERILRKDPEAELPGHPFRDLDELIVEQLMKVNGIRAAQIAVTRDGKLKYARAYTWAEPLYKKPRLFDRFRLGSVSKAITASAIMNLEGSGKLDLDDSVLELLRPSDTPLRNFFGQEPTDPRFGQVTVDHLLCHLGGWRDAEFLEDSIVYTAIQNALGITVPLPTTKAQWVSYVASENEKAFQGTPGKIWMYSNMGFSLLARVVAAVSLKHYDKFVQDTFFKLGIPRDRVKLALSRQFAEDEPPFHNFYPRLWKDYSQDWPSDDAGRPWISTAYGINFDSFDGHGGWALSAVDCARFLASFDAPDVAHPVMTASARAKMWNYHQREPGAKYNENQPKSGDYRGWYYNELTYPNDAVGSVTRTLIHHNGGTAGSSAFMARRTDGVSFVVLINMDVAGFTVGNVGEKVSQAIDNIVHWPAGDMFEDLGFPPFSTP